MDFQKLCDTVIKLDDKVRTVYVFNDSAKVTAKTMREGIQPYLPNDVVRLTVDNAFIRWRTRLNLRDWIGNPIYAMAKYEKIKRFSFFLDPKHLLIVTTDLDIHSDDFTDKVLDRMKNNDDSY